MIRRLDTPVRGIVILGILLLLGGCAASSDVLLRKNEQAEQSYAAGHLAAARSLYTELLRASPDNPKLWARLGNCNALLGHPHQAALDYTRALHLQPQQPVVRYNLAVLRIKEARAQLIALTAAPDLPPALSAAATRLLAALPRLQSPMAETTSSR